MEELQLNTSGCTLTFTREKYNQPKVRPYTKHPFKSRIVEKEVKEMQWWLNQFYFYMTLNSLRAWRRWHLPNESHHFSQDETKAITKAGGDQSLVSDIGFSGPFLWPLISFPVFVSAQVLSVCFYVAIVWR